MTNTYSTGALRSPWHTDVDADGVRRRSSRRLAVLLWLYFFLLVFEGSIRKWVPPLSNAFLVIRDPIALAVWYTGAKLGIGSRRVWATFYSFALVITVLGLLQLLTSSLHPAIIIYGWRSYVLQFPVAIIMASFLDAKFLRKLGLWTLILCPFMTLLMTYQYLSPPAAWINRGVGDGGEQIFGALGHIRPAGTFSYNTGPGSFYPFALAIVFWGLANRGLYSRWMVLLSGACILIAIPISVSRSLAITCGAVICASALGLVGRSGIAFDPKQLPRFAIGVIAFCALSFGLYQVPVVADAVNTFTVRWTNAQGETQDNSALEERSSGIFLDALGPLTDDRLLGRGIGAGSSVAAAIEGKSLTTFEFGEGSLGREMHELGPPVGLLFLLARVFLTIWLVIVAFKAALSGRMLPIFLLVPTMILVFAGPLDIVSSQGFLVAYLGIFVASLGKEKSAGPPEMRTIQSVTLSGAQALPAGRETDLCGSADAAL